MRTNDLHYIFLICELKQVYDWAGSIDTSMPLHFTIQRGTEVLRHDDKLENHEVLGICERVSGCFIFVVILGITRNQTGTRLAMET